MEENAVTSGPQLSQVGPSLGVDRHDDDLGRLFGDCGAPRSGPVRRRVGRLDEPVWRTAHVFDDLRQIIPEDDGEPTLVEIGDEPITIEMHPGALRVVAVNPGGRTS